MKYLRLWYVWAFATAISLALWVCSKCGERRLSQRLREMECVQRNFMAVRFAPKDWSAGHVDRIALSSICNEIFNAYTNNHYAAFGGYVDRLGTIWDGGTATGCANWKRIESVFRHCAHDGFLFPVQSLHFASAKEFEKYIQINVDLCCLCGELHIRRNEFEKAHFVECLVLSRLNQLKEKYLRDGDVRYSQIVDKYMAQWIGQIESPEGFSRAFAEYSFRLNTEYADALKPGKGLPREKALRCARAAAIGLIKSGYKPKWLGEYKGESTEPDPWEK